MKGEGKLLGVGIFDSPTQCQLFEIVEGKTTVVWQCPYYLKWKDMLTRCYSARVHKSHPFYAKCTVCEEWLTFSNFKQWMEQQEWEDKHLDKDLLHTKGMPKIYSPETCLFIDEKLNNFLVTKKSKASSLPLGVNVRGRKFEASCHNPFTKKREYLGVYSTPEQAHEAWKIRKIERVYEILAAGWIENNTVAEKVVEYFEQEKYLD